MDVTRTNYPVIAQSLESSYVTCILGPRRVGKSTLVLDYAKKHPDYRWVFLNMDYEDEKIAVTKRGLKTLIQERSMTLLDQENKLWISIDEAQKCPALFDQIKLIYDAYKNQNAIKFILTGSGLLSLHQLSAESLAGRVELFYLREFGLRESAFLKDKIPFPSESVLDAIFQKDIPPEPLSAMIDRLSPFRVILEKALEEQLIWGGLPEVLSSENTADRLKYLSNYLQTYLEKDIRALSTISDLSIYRHLIEILAEQTGSVRDDTKIKEILGCSRDTLKKYRGYLMATLLYQDIYPFIGSSLKRLVKSPKGYLVNNGLINYLRGIYDRELLEKSGLIGHCFENWFLKELQIALDREVKHHAIYYWRSQRGIEVDFVVEQKPSVFPFEVTYSTQVNQQKVRNLRRFLHEEPEAKQGFYVYRGNYHFDADNRICFLPAWVIG